MSTKMRRYEAPILEAWATWEIFRKLGFAADDIYWLFSNTLNAIPRPGVALNIQLKTQNKEFTVTCSQRLSEGEARRLESSSRKFQEQLSSASFDEAEMIDVLHESFAWKNKSDLLVALVSNGFVFPFKTMN